MQAPAGLGSFSGASSTNELKKGEIGKMFLDVSALSETKLKGKGEVLFGEVVGRVSGVDGGRARELVALLLSGWC